MNDDDRQAVVITSALICMAIVLIVAFALTM